MSSTEARRFGVESLILFGLIGVWLWLRKHHPLAGAAIGGTGALLFVGALVAPAAVLLVKRVWMGFAGVLGRINGTLLLIVIFFLVLTPVALLRRVFGRGTNGGWEPHEKRAPDHFEDPY